jgi:pSer/pThr/pTyr-binding forkhead associated (FHA) protein
MSKYSCEAFLDACEATGPLQVAVESGAGSSQHLLDQPFAVIGRTPRCDLVLNDEEVSRRHAYLQILGGYVYCFDLHSRTGTRWNRDPELRSAWLFRDEAVAVGPFQVRLVRGGREAAAPAVTLGSPLEAGGVHDALLPEVLLEFSSPSAPHLAWLMNRRLVLVGSAADCRIRLRDADVSSVHCSLVRTPSGVWVVDLFGRSGILINGVAARTARLDEGDELQVGKTTIRIRYGKPTADDTGDHVHERNATNQDDGGVSTGADRDVAAADSSDALPVASHRLAVLPRSAAAAPPLPNTQGSALRLSAGEALVPREMADPLLSTLVTQFGQMQQQMFDQFQQTMMMMVQMFSGMHREQFGLLREELDRVQQLSQELATLQAELANQQASASGSGPAPASPRVRETRPARSGRLFAGRVSKIAPPRMAESAAPIEPGAPKMEGVVPNMDTPIPSPPPEQKTNGEPVPSEPAPSASEAPEDVHAWLRERIEAIQQERQTRWQKILGFLSGKRPGE